MNIAYKDKDLENLGLISITKYYLDVVGAYRISMYPYFIK